MQAMTRYKIGGFLLSSGAVLLLAIKIIWLLRDSKFPIMYRAVGTTFGVWLVQLVMPPTINGHTYGFKWSSMATVPWAAVFLVFLLWMSVIAIRGRSKINLAALSLLGVLGVWFTFGLLYRSVYMHFLYFTLPMKHLLPNLMVDLAIPVIIIGIALILFNHKDAMQGDSLETSSDGDMSLGQLLFSFKGRIPRVKVWLYQVLLLNFIFTVCIGMGVLAGMQGGEAPGYVAVIFGQLLVIWPSLALGVKRCHDRNRSGWFVLVALVPVVSIWYAVEILFLPGSPGDNKYGPDPLAIQERS